MKVSHHNHLLPLELLNAGETADVAEVVGEPSWISRLGELGIRIGSRLQMLQAGSPCMIQVDGARLSLRTDLGRHVLVRLAHATPQAAEAT